MNEWAKNLFGSLENTGLIRFAFVATLSILQLGAGVAYVESTEQVGGPGTSVVAVANVEPKVDAVAEKTDEPEEDKAPAITPAPSRSIALTIVAIASPFVTLLIGALTIASKHRITEHQLAIEDAHDTKAQEIEAKQKAIEIRLALLERGIACEHQDCPVVEIAAGKRPWDTLPPIRKRTLPCSGAGSCPHATVSANDDSPEEKA